MPLIFIQLDGKHVYINWLSFLGSVVTKKCVLEPN